MKAKIIYSWFLVVTLLFSCKEEVLSPNFDVRAVQNVINVTDSAKFIFTGNPDNITFYSGEPGNDYQHRFRSRVAGNTLEFNFKSWVDRADAEKVATLLVSTDFTGKVDTNNIKAAKWVDITSRANFSTGADQTPSGTIDLSEFSNTGKPVTIAFKYANKVIKSPNSRLVIRTIEFNRKSPSGAIVNISQMATTAWGTASFKNPAAVWTVTSAQLLMTGSATSLDEDWVVSNSFDINATKPDFGITLKNITTDTAPYSHKFDSPGVYKVVFVASNRAGNEVKEEIKELTITVK